jgi:hypothetical protein
MSKRRRRHPPLIILSPAQHAALAIFQAHVLGTADTPGCPSCQRSPIHCDTGMRLASNIATGQTAEREKAK